MFGVQEVAAVPSVWHAGARNDTGYQSICRQALSARKVQKLRAAQEISLAKLDECKQD